MKTIQVSRKQLYISTLLIGAVLVFSPAARAAGSTFSYQSVGGNDNISIAANEDGSAFTVDGSLGNWSSSYAVAGTGDGDTTDIFGINGTGLGHAFPGANTPTNSVDTEGNGATINVHNGGLGDDLQWTITAGIGSTIQVGDDNLLNSAGFANATYSITAGSGSGVTFNAAPWFSNLTNPLFTDRIYNGTWAGNNGVFGGSPAAAFNFESMTYTVTITVGSGSTVTIVASNATSTYTVTM
ncbi:MAG: hypothetical protein HY247_04120 [archaeon]|nr:MAG: hypothetical protein HY247_04120 [archaeon]